MEKQIEAVIEEYNKNYAKNGVKFYFDYLDGDNAVVGYKSTDNIPFIDKMTPDEIYKSFEAHMEPLSEKIKNILNSEEGTSEWVDGVLGANSAWDNEGNELDEPTDEGACYSTIQIYR